MPSLATVLALTATSLAVAVPTAAAQAPAPAPAGTITAVGTASIKPVPTDAKSNDSIASAVRAARRQAIPAAVSDARNRAVLLAAAGRLTLGALLGIADTSPSPPFFYGAYGQDGTFGPGKYCGLVAHYRATRINGVFHRKLINRTRTCRVPRQITATEAVTFAASSS